MALRTRGLIMLAAAIIGIVVNIVDAADDGFSLWNGIGIACFLLVGFYGIAWLNEGEPR